MVNQALWHSSTDPTYRAHSPGVGEDRADHPLGVGVVEAVLHQGEVEEGVDLHQVQGEVEGVGEVHLDHLGEGVVVVVEGLPSPGPLGVGEVAGVRWDLPRTFQHF